MREVGNEGRQLDFDQCIFLTRRYLDAQGWELMDAETLAVRIWSELKGRGLSGEEAEKAVNTGIWQNYAAVLYDYCRRSEPRLRELAWAELHRWLLWQAPRYIDNAKDQEDAVQEAVINLQKAFETDSLQAPRALWVFALQALQNIGISRYRWRAAAKRDEDKIDSLEEGKQRRPAETLPLRRTEDAVISKIIRQQLEEFFQSHLNSELQLEVARASFLDGLTPAEIAGLLQKTPHEVRMVKARVVQTLRALPAAEQERLLGLLGRAVDEEEGDDGDLHDE